MIEIGNKIVSADIFTKHFVCDLQACKGACCVEGDSGAPLEKAELEIIKNNMDEVLPFMNQKGIETIEKFGLFVEDQWDGEMVTPLVENKECAYVVFDENGFTKCAFELAYLAGKTSFKKPISCHLYPIRVSEYKNFTALNYHKWDICKPACACGEKLKVKVYQFAKDSLIRKFGESFYHDLKEVDKTLERLKT